MSIPTEEPKLVRQDRVSGDEYSHPAYAMISVHRLQGNVGQLVGSDLNHHHCIRLEIMQASRQRSLARDWWYPHSHKKIIVDLSEHQWASFLTNFNTSGVPCTLVEFNGERVPRLKEQSKFELVQKELANTAKKTIEKVKLARLHINKLINGEIKVNKKTLTEALALLNSAEQDAVSNMPYQVEQHKEAMEKNVEAAKSEIEGYVTHTLTQRGLESLKGPTYGELADGTRLQSDESETDRG